MPVPLEAVDLTPFLCPSDYIDSDNPRVRARAMQIVGQATHPIEQARLLYRAVRDGIRYNPYVDYTKKDTYRASSVLAQGNGYCVGKAALYAALCRTVGIPARIGLADVRNHLATPRLLEAVASDVFAYHGYVDIRPAHQWIKVTPVFNANLCAKLGVAPLEFHGDADALLQPYDAAGRKFMTYLADHGTFIDVPVQLIMSEMARLYPKLCQPGGFRGPSMEEESARA